MTGVFNSQQHSVIVGSLLGDGSILRQKSGSCYFCKPQAEKHRDYLQWHFDCFLPFSSSLRDYDNRADGKVYRKSQFITHIHPVFKELRDDWYPTGKKRVPRSIMLDPLSIAVWFFDDGSNYVKNRECRLATYCFPRDDCEFLCSLLLQFQIRAFVTKTNVIQIYAESYKSFVDLVRPFMLWPCFAHKIQYRDSELDYTTEDEARKMFEMYESGTKQKEIAEAMGKSVSVVSAILRGNRLRHLGLSKVGSLPLSNTSGIKGVSWDKTRNKWKASVKIDGKTKHLGRFETKEEARIAIQAFL